MLYLVSYSYVIFSDGTVNDTMYYLLYCKLQNLQSWYVVCFPLYLVQIKAFHAVVLLYPNHNLPILILHVSNVVS